MAVLCDRSRDWESKKNCNKTLRGGKGKKLLGNLTVLRPANLTFFLKRLWDISSWNPSTDMRWARRYSEIANMDCLYNCSDYKCDCVEKQRAMWAVTHMGDFINDLGAIHHLQNSHLKAEELWARETKCLVD